MKKLTLLSAAFFSIIFFSELSAQTFTFDPGDVVTEYVELETYKNIQINMAHPGYSDITFGWVTIENNILDKWEYTSCDNGGCYSLLPDSATVGPLADTVPAYIRLTVNPRDQLGTSTVKIYVYNVKYPDDGKVVSFDITAIAPTSIFENETEAIHVYPNPANDYIILKNTFDTPSPFVLIDMAGKTILTDIVNSNSDKTIKLEAFPKGIYFVRFQTGQVDETRKIIVQ